MKSPNSCLRKAPASAPVKARKSRRSRATDALSALLYAFDFRTPSDLAALGPYYAFLKAAFDALHEGIWEEYQNSKKKLPCSIKHSFLLSALFLDLYAFLPIYALWTIPKLFEIALRRVRRPTYYAAENARRQELARERRKIRKRTTINRAPTPEALRAQWARIRKSPRDMLIFGSMLEDLEAYVDNSLVRDEEGQIVGRKGGIKEWLRDNCPELWAKYSSVMRFKAMAKKFKQVVALEDPYPITMALCPTEPPEGWTAEDEARSIRKAEALAEGKILRCGRKVNGDAWEASGSVGEEVDEGKREEERSEEERRFVERWNSPEAVAGRRFAGRMATARDETVAFLGACTQTEASVRLALATRLGLLTRPAVGKALGRSPQTA